MRKFKLGDIVVDQDFDVGEVVRIDDPHNIFIKLFNVEGSGIYCTVSKCEFYSPLKLLQAVED